MQEALAEISVKADFAGYAKVLFVAAMIPNAQKVRKMFMQRKEVRISTFRGGEDVGAVEMFNESVNAFQEQKLAAVQKSMEKWKDAGDRRACVEALRSIVKDIVSPQSAVYGFGPSKQKKFVEFLMLGSCRTVLGMQGDWGMVNGLADIWPVPATSKSMLQKIFPNARSEKQIREGIVALLRVLRHSGGHCFASLVGQLCWWAEQCEGRIDWRE